MDALSTYLCSPTQTKWKNRIGTIADGSSRRTPYDHRILYSRSHNTPSSPLAYSLPAVRIDSSLVLLAGASSESSGLPSAARSREAPLRARAGAAILTHGCTSSTGLDLCDQVHWLFAGVVRERDMDVPVGAIALGFLAEFVSNTASDGGGREDHRS